MFYRLQTTDRPRKIQTASRMLRDRTGDRGPGRTDHKGLSAAEGVDTPYHVKHRSKCFDDAKNAGSQKTYASASKANGLENRGRIVIKSVDARPGMIELSTLLKYHTETTITTHMFWMNIRAMPNRRRRLFVGSLISRSFSNRPLFAPIAVSSSICCRTVLISQFR